MAWSLPGQSVEQYVLVEQVEEQVRIVLTDWPGKLSTIRWVYTEIVRKIAPGETVRLLVRSKAEARSAARLLERAGADVAAVEFLVHPTNRGWTRDSGPLFVRRCAARKLETAIVQFHFNAWAKYTDWHKDRRVPETAAAYLAKRLFSNTMLERRRLAGTVPKQRPWRAISRKRSRRSGN